MGKANGKIGLKPKLTVVYYVSEMSENEVMVFCLKSQSFPKCCCCLCEAGHWLSFHAGTQQLQCQIFVNELHHAKYICHGPLFIFIFPI